MAARHATWPPSLCSSCGLVRLIFAAVGRTFSLSLNPPIAVPLVLCDSRAPYTPGFNNSFHEPHQLPFPDPTTVINKASLMAMEHNTCLEILDKLVSTSMWGTPKHMALLMEMEIDAMAISKQNSIQVPFVLFILYYFIVLRGRLSTNVCGSTTHHLASFLI